MILGELLIGFGVCWVEVYVGLDLFCYLVKECVLMVGLVLLLKVLFEEVLVWVVNLVECLWVVEKEFECVWMVSVWVVVINVVVGV